MLELLDRIYRRNIDLKIENDKLQILIDDDDTIDQDFIEEIRENKNQLLEYLKKYGKNQSEYSGIRRTENNGEYHLTSSQLRMWTICQFEAELVAYNMTNSVVLGSQYDLRIFEKAIIKTLNRHDILRTVFFKDKNDVILQKVKTINDLQFHVNFKDFSSYENSKEEIEKFIDSDSKKPFNLGEGPLIRAFLLKVNAGETIFYYNIHHIIGDGWSFNILFRDVREFYKALIENRDVDLPELNFQFGDYAEWLRENSSKLESNDSHWYWMNKLQGNLGGIDLPSKKDRPKIKTNNGRKLALLIPPEQHQKLINLCRNLDGSLFMGLVTSFKILLFKYTNQSDLIIGTPVAGRNHLGLENQIGYYVNTLVLRNEIKSDDSYSDLFSRVKEDILNSYRYQHYPFEKIIEELDLKRDLSRSSIFDVMVTLHTKNDFSDDILMKYLEINDIGREPSRFDLEVDFEETSQGLYMSLLFNEDVYQGVLIKQFIQHYAEMLGKLTSTPDKRISGIPVLNQKDQESLQNAFNNKFKEIDFEKTFIDRFTATADLNPNAIAVEYENEKLTYKELDSITNRISHYLLQKKAVNSGDNIGILTKRSHHTLIAMISAFKCGCAYVPLDIRYPVSRVREMVQDSDIKMLFITEDQVEKSMKLQWECDSLDQLFCLDGAIDNKFTNRDAEYKELWEYVGKNSDNEILGGGWISSFTGLPFSEKEMDEYAQSFFENIEQFLHPEARVLEIGCASGLTMKKIFPFVKSYVAVDISEIIINELKYKFRDNPNTEFYNMSALELDNFPRKSFDVIIINSVVQDFESHNYLKTVLQKAWNLLTDGGTLCLGDIMNLDLKEMLLGDLKSFRLDPDNQIYNTKTDFSSELFLPRDYFNDTAFFLDGFVNIKFYDKHFTISNELTDYRYDVSLTKSKRKVFEKRKRIKFQNDIQDLTDQEINPVNLVNQNSTAYIIFTSGTTGKPKGVVINQNGLINHLLAMIDEMNLGNKSIIVQNAEVSFDISVWQFLTALLTGGKTLIYDHETILDPKLFLNKIYENKASVLQVVPSYLSILLNSDDKRSMSELDYLLVTGEQVDKTLLNKYFSQYPDGKVINAYGPAEVSDDATLFEINPSLREDYISVGKPIQNMNIYILDSQENICPIGVKGEICISGIGVADGYLNNRELTTSKFKKSPFDDYNLYKSGDYGFWDEHGNIYFLGRSDDQIKIRGFRVEIEEIRKQLCKITEEGVVVVRDDELWAFHTSNIENNLIREELSAVLPEYMVPNRIIKIDQIPLSINGKIDKKSLPFSIGESKIDLIEPNTDTEKKLAAIWRDILEVRILGIHSSFFELGGHSLKVIKMMFSIEEEFGVRIKIDSFFRKPTIYDLAKSVESLVWVNSDEDNDKEDEIMII